MSAERIVCVGHAACAKLAASLSRHAQFVLRASHVYCDVLASLCRGRRISFCGLGIFLVRSWPRYCRALTFWFFPIRPFAVLAATTYYDSRVAAGRSVRHCKLFYVHVNMLCYVVFTFCHSGVACNALFFMHAAVAVEACPC